MKATRNTLISMKDSEAKSKYKKIVVDDETVAQLEKIARADRTLMHTSYISREAQFILHGLDRRIYNADFESVCDFFGNDSNIEFFENEQEFIKANRADADILLQGEYLQYFRACDVSQIDYDFNTAKWVRKSPLNEAISFGITSDGALSEFSIQGNILARNRSFLDISGFFAISQYIEFLRSNPKPDGIANKNRASLASIFEAIYIPFYKNPGELTPGQNVSVEIRGTPKHSTDSPSYLSTIDAGPVSS